MTACLWGVPHLGSYVLRGRGFLAYRESRVLQHSLKTRAAKLHRAVRVVTVFAFLREQNLPCLDAFNVLTIMFFRVVSQQGRHSVDALFP